MAKITPIDVIKGISGKYGGNSNDYFATNTSSNKIHLAKLKKPYKGPFTDKQLAQQEVFAARQAALSAWLVANRPSAENGEKGTEAYQYAQKLKRAYAMSNINQVLLKYMDDKYVITLPAGAGSSNKPSTGGSDSGSGSDSSDSPSGGGGGEDGGLSPRG